MEWTNEKQKLYEDILNTWKGGMSDSETKLIIAEVRLRSLLKQVAEQTDIIKELKK